MIKSKTQVRKLVNLTCPRQWDRPPVYHISFAYYERAEAGGLIWTGDNESCKFTEEELYEVLKSYLKPGHVEVTRVR